MGQRRRSRNASIVLAACADTAVGYGFFTAMQNLVNSNNPPPVMSLSYGVCEVESGSALNASINSLYQQAVAEGISIFVAAGDAGAASCDLDQTTATHGIGVSGFASTPYNVAVGGTDFSDTLNGATSQYWSATNTAAYGSALSYIPEIPWKRLVRGRPARKLYGLSHGLWRGRLFATAAQPWPMDLSQSPPVAEVQATAPPERHRSRRSPAAPVRDTPSPLGRPDCPAYQAMACATSPTFLCSLRSTRSGDTIWCFAFPTNQMEEPHARELPAIGPAAAARPLHRRSWPGFRLS